MLRQCEFNGKKDVLHFKLLQAAINQNNAKKVIDQSAEKMNENFNTSSKHVLAGEEKNDENDQSGNNNQLLDNFRTLVKTL